ncbi:restriction endonuclease subunit S [Candidatus Bathyarchaeota archaeon]|nr:restriction endonuclease subunit S [Candidatus Bathyarchaeota archaeon]
MTTTEKQLPNGWQWAKLGNVCEIIAGQSPPSSTYRREPEGLPFFQGKADFGLIHPIATAWCVSPNKIAIPGDILISVRAPVGPTNVADVECCIGRGLAAIRCGKDADQTFILYTMRRFEDELVRKGSGSTFEAISRNDLIDFTIPLPPLSDQKRIVKILNEQMAAVEKARKAVCDNFDTTNILSSAYLRNTFSQDNLNRWPKKRFGDIAQIIAKQVNPTLPEYRDLPHVNGENIESGTGRLTYLNTAAEEQMISGKYLFPKGSVLYSKLRPYLRKVALVDFDGVCSADMYPIQVDSNYLRHDFVAWLLLSDEFTNYAVSESQRARMPKLNRKQLFSWEAPLPTLDEQKEMINKLILQMEKATILNQKVEELVNTIEALPSALLRKAFMGEI